MNKFKTASASNVVFSSLNGSSIKLQRGRESELGYNDALESKQCGFTQQIVALIGFENNLFLQFYKNIPGCGKLEQN